MPLDIRSSTPRREFRLSFVIASGLFIIIFLVATAILLMTFHSSKLVVEQQREFQQNQSAAISELVMSARLESVHHVVNLTSEDPTFREVQGAGTFTRLSAYLRGIFYSQKDSSVGYLAVLDGDSKIQVELHNEIYPLDNLREQLEMLEHTHEGWHWLVQENGPESTANVLVYYSREILDTMTGKVSGYLIGGILLSSDQELVNAFRNRTGADFSILAWKDRVLSISGQIPNEILFTHTQPVTDLQDEKDNGYWFFTTPVLETEFNESHFSLINGFKAQDEQAIEKFYLIAVIVVLVMTLVISVISAISARSLLLRPLKDLVVFARKAERQDTVQELPLSPIDDFNEVARNLARVLQAFQESEKRFQDFVSVSSDSVWETDPDNKYVFLSRDVNSSNKIDLNRVLGKKRWEVNGVDLEFGDWDQHRRTLANRLPFRNFIFRRIDPGGKALYWSASGKPRYDSDGKFAGYRGTSSNITAEIEAQKEAIEIQDQLRQSQKLEIVGQLTGGVAHDFNNLLSIVLGNLELIQEKDLLEGQSLKNLKDAIRGAERGASLTHQLLAYSRQQTLNPVSARPVEVIQNMRSLLERALGETIKVKTDLRDQWSVLIDPNELENAIINLAVNARDAMNTGGELIIECFDTHLDQEYTNSVEELLPGDYVCVVVSDTGEGIPDEVKDRIMEPFFTTKEVGKGSGLGLSMVFGFVKQSGGHVTIYSEVGKGTSIQLYLPRLKEETEEAEETGKIEVRRGDNQRILVVEDNTEVRELIVAQLNSIGYRTLESENGPEALAILEKEEVDFLLSDVSLPAGMNGVEIVKKASKIYPDLSLLLMSGFTGNAIRSQGERPQGVEILYKPFTKARLSEALHKAAKSGRRKKTA
ncbi:MAG: ATP-binding protein [Sneathiellales bacterium]|nr:ATP-binding protein [Sneathiellales bacterium]